MKKIDFGHIVVQNIEGKDVNVDLRKTLGESMYINSRNYDGFDLGRTIYRSEGEIELTDEQVNIVMMFMESYPYVTREAVKTILEL